MHSKITTLPEKKIIGISMEMSLVANMTGELWRSFMTRRNEIQSQIGMELYSIQLFESGYYEKFNPSNVFAKWAGAEVSNFENIPIGMQKLIIPTGEYVVFEYKGLSTDTSIFQYIYSEWLPNSDYQFDYRPQFEILGEKYKNNSIDSEEEIWIPIKKKSLN